MQTVETSSSVEAQHCRRAQYSGRAAELSLNGSKILGMVRSVGSRLSDRSFAALDQDQEPGAPAMMRAEEGSWKC